eukprot:1160755-Pelagomonas_calceolata.AAC.4
MLAGLRRRGVSSAAINAFCRDMGITRNENVIPMHKLEYHVRAFMEATSPRALAVMRPLKVRGEGGGGAHACVHVMSAHTRNPLGFRATPCKS